LRWEIVLRRWGDESVWGWRFLVVRVKPGLVVRPRRVGMVADVW